MTRHGRPSRPGGPTALFFLVAFGVPWVGWSAVRVLGLTDPSPLRVALLYTGDFCSVGGLVAMYAWGGRKGAGQLLKRCVDFRVSPIWWIVALVLPFLISCTAFVLVGVRGGGVGALDVGALASYVAPGALMAFTTGPLGEELGWRGYLTPRLLETSNALVVSLVVGFLWGIWHVPLYLDSVFSSAPDALAFVAGIMLTTIIMTTIALHTRGSVLVAVVYHWLSNVTSGVVDGLFVDIDGGDVRLVSLGVEAVIAGAFILVLGPGLTRRDHDISYEAPSHGTAREGG